MVDRRHTSERQERRVDSLESTLRGAVAVESGWLVVPSVLRTVWCFLRRKKNTPDQQIRQRKFLERAVRFDVLPRVFSSDLHFENIQNIHMLGMAWPPDTIYSPIRAAGFNLREHVVASSMKRIYGFLGTQNRGYGSRDHGRPDQAISLDGGHWPLSAAAGR